VLGAGCWVLGAGCWVLGAGCWVLGAGCWMLGAGCWVLGVFPTLWNICCCVFWPNCLSAFTAAVVELEGDAGADPVSLAKALNGLGNVLHAQRRLEDAETHYRRAIEVYVRVMYQYRSLALCGVELCRVVSCGIVWCPVVPCGGVLVLRKWHSLCSSTCCCVFCVVTAGAYW
jgi:hypothetical protein